MTDTEQKRIEAVCKVAHIDDISDLSDGYHTFKQLYYQRMVLFAVLVKQNRDKAWKSLRHSDGELCFGGGWFIVGIDTPEGSYTYHYEDNYFSLFDCVELERGKSWDGHTEKDVTRLLSLEQEPCDDAISRQDALRAFMYAINGERLPDYDCDNYPVTYDLRYIKKTLRALPPVTPRQKTGHWMIDEDSTDRFFATYECSCCKRAIIVPHDVMKAVYKDYPFCHCGAKMVEPQERSDKK